MNATFDIRVSIETDKVTTCFCSERIEDMDTQLLTAVLKVFGDVKNRVKKQVAQFFGVAKEQQDNVPADEEEAQMTTAPITPNNQTTNSPNDQYPQ